MTIPTYLAAWFSKKGWKIHSYQKKMFDFAKKKQSVLLIAPTGGGKTLASFLPSLIDIHASDFKELHTLYVSPLKALTADIQRNLFTPIQEMNLAVSVETRTGDTSSYRRQRQRAKPPNILLTTPESLMLLLSYSDAHQFFQSLKVVIIDELHTFVSTKRGDLLSLGLAKLSDIAKQSVRVGLSATIAEPDSLAKWLSTKNQTCVTLIVKSQTKPVISLLAEGMSIPYSGYMARHSTSAIYQTIHLYKMTLIFVNTRAQAEALFQLLWLANEFNFPMAIYHGSLSKEQRQKTETLVAEKKLRAIVATSALELGIDWGDIDCVIQVGAPHGISRLVQRIGRSNHQFNQSSVAKLVPVNCFDALECLAAMNAIDKGKLDTIEFHLGSLDVVVQFIVNCACSEEVHVEKLYSIVTNAFPYRSLSYSDFSSLFNFAINGGYVLKHYERYHRLIMADGNHYKIASPQFARRHRQNIGTIIESARLNIKVLNKRKDKIIGSVEENFIQQFSPADTFLFGGQVLEFIRIRDMYVETRKVTAKYSKLPSYMGGTLPLSTDLAEEVRSLICNPIRWKNLPEKVQNWLQLQKQFSMLPDQNHILIESCTYKKSFYLTVFSFEGKTANHTLGILLSKRMEKLKLKPLSFTATDYGMTIRSMEPVNENQIPELLSSTILQKELAEWLSKSSLLKRSFRQVAIISGLIERQIAGTRKTVKQVTFSTDLIYDVLQRHEPEHILLAITRFDVDRRLLDISRLQAMLQRFQHKFTFMELDKPSPMSIPIINTFNTENIHASATEEMLSQAEKELAADEMMEEVKKSVARKS